MHTYVQLDLMFSYVQFITNLCIYLQQWNFRTTLLQPAVILHEQLQVNSVLINTKVQEVSEYAEYILQYYICKIKNT